MSKHIEVEYNGVKYQSLKEFCYEFELNYELVKRRLRNGWSLEDAISKPRERVCTNIAKGFSYNGKEYSSFKSFCKEHSLNYDLVKSRLRNGWSLEDAISKPARVRRNMNSRDSNMGFSYNGKEYSSVYSFCKEYGLSYNLVKNRLRSGWSLEDAISKPARMYSNIAKGFSYNGKEYSSIFSFCKEHGLDYNLIKNRLMRGWSLEDSISKSKENNGKKFIYNDKEYSSIRSFCKEHDLSYSIFYHGLGRGYSIEECIVYQDIDIKKQSDFFYECNCKHCGLKFLGTLEIAKKHAREHKEDYENMILNYQD